MERGPGTTRAGIASLARIVMLIGSLVAALLVAGILLVVLDANPDNNIVDWVTEAARWLAGPFRNLFDIANNEWRVAVNWGLAAFVYLAISRLVASLMLR